MIIPCFFPFCADPIIEFVHTKQTNKNVRPATHIPHSYPTLQLSGRIPW